MFREHTARGKNNKNIQIKHPVSPSEAYFSVLTYIKFCLH